MVFRNSQTICEDLLMLLLVAVQTVDKPNSLNY